MDNVSQWNVGDAKIDGGGRNDVLRSGECDDILWGEDGDEKLYGIIGKNIMRSGRGLMSSYGEMVLIPFLEFRLSQGSAMSNDYEIVNSQ